MPRINFNVDVPKEEQKSLEDITPKKIKAEQASPYGKDSKKLVFLGVVTTPTKLVTVAGESRQDVIGVKFRWDGDKPLSVHKDKIIGYNKDTETLLSNNKKSQLETIEIKKGEEFSTTRIGSAVLTTRNQFKGYAFFEDGTKEAGVDVYITFQAPKRNTENDKLKIRYQPLPMYSEKTDKKVSSRLNEYPVANSVEEATPTTIKEEFIEIFGEFFNKPTRARNQRIQVNKSTFEAFVNEFSE